MSSTISSPLGFFRCARPVVVEQATLYIEDTPKYGWSNCVYFDDKGAHFFTKQSEAIDKPFGK